MIKPVIFLHLFMSSFIIPQADSIVNMENLDDFDFSILFVSDSVYFEDTEKMIERIEPIGFIGEDYQRFYIHYTSVERDSVNPSKYHVTGKTKVKNNVCDFEGLLNITQTKNYTEPEIPNWYYEGSIKGNYIFREDKNQYGTGVFKGEFESFFWIDSSGLLKYNTLWLVADGYTNNQFEGVWQSYRSGKVKKCNWGDCRIPDSKKLDDGAGEFCPNEKYIKNGWENYIEEVYGDKERDIWWK